MKKKFRKIINLIAAVITSIILISIGFLVFIKTSAGQNFLKDLISGQIENNLKVRVEIGRIETNLLNYFNADEISVYNINENDTSLILSTAKLKIKYNFYDLLFKRKLIDHLYIDSILITVQRDSSGNFNLPSFPEKTAEEDTAFTLPVKIISGEIRHINIFYKDNYIPLKFSCLNLQTTIKRGAGNDYNLNTSIDSLKLEYFNEPITINNLFSRSFLNENLDAKIDSFYADFTGLKLKGKFFKHVNRLTGNINIFGNPKKLLDVISGNPLAEYSGSSINGDLNFAALYISSSPELSFDLKFPDYKVNEIPIHNFTLKGNWISDTLNLSNLSFNSLNGYISSSGLIVLDSLLNHHFYLEADNINVAPVIKTITGYKNFIDKPINVDFNLNSNGNLSNPGSLKIKSGIGLRYGNTKVLNAHLEFRKKQFHIRSDSELVTINSDMIINENGYNGKLIIDFPSLAPLLSLVKFNGFSGQSEVNSDLSGNWSGFNLNTRVKSSGIYFNDHKIVDTIYAASILTNDQLFLDSSLITGRIPNIDSIASVIGLDSIKGELKYSLSAEGPVKEPHALLTAQINKPSYGPFSLDNMDFLAELNRNTVSISEFSLKKDSLLLTANGIINLADKSGELRLSVLKDDSVKTGSISSAFIINSFDDYSFSSQSNDFQLENLNEFVPGLEINSGQLSWQFILSNEDNKLNADLPFAISDLRRKSLLIDTVNGSFGIHNDKFSADSIAVNIKGNKAYFNLSLDLQKEQNKFYSVSENSKSEGNISGDSLELQLLNPLIESYATLSGHSNIDLRWNGLLKNPNLEGKITFDRGSINLTNNRNLIFGINGDIAFRDSAIETNGIKAFFGKKPLSIKAKLNQHDTTTLAAMFQVSSNDTLLINSKTLLNRDSIDFNFEADNLDIALGSPFVPALQNVKGTLSSKLSLIGRNNDPDINGSIRIKDISYNPDLLNLSVNDGNIITHINSNRIIIDTAYFNIGKGIISANGNLFYDSNTVKNINIDLLAKNIQLSEKRTFSLRLKHAALKLGSTGERYKLGGTIELGTSRYEQNFELTDFWKALVAKTESVLHGPSDEPLDLTEYFETYPAMLTGISDYFKKLDLDIALQNSDSIWVDNNIAHFRIHPDVTLKGSIEIPLINGRISVEEDGRIKFLDREFNITQGLVEFNNPERLDPSINISAESDVTSSTGSLEDDETYLIKLNIIGPLDDLDFNLNSEPALDQADIVSLLSLGVTYQQLQASGNADALLKNRAEVLSTLALSNQLNSYFDKWLGDYIDIDRIGIGGNAFDLGQTRFEVTKKWSDNVELSYSTAIDKLDKQILQAKIKVMKYLYLEGKTDQENESGADVLFRIKFK